MARFKKTSSRHHETESANHLRSLSSHHQPHISSRNLLNSSPNYHNLSPTDSLTAMSRYSLRSLSSTHYLSSSPTHYLPRLSFTVKTVLCLVLVLTDITLTLGDQSCSFQHQGCTYNIQLAHGEGQPPQNDRCIDRATDVTLDRAQRDYVAKIDTMERTVGELKDAHGLRIKVFRSSDTPLSDGTRRKKGKRKTKKTRKRRRRKNKRKRELKRENVKNDQSKPKELESTVNSLLSSGSRGTGSTLTPTLPEPAALTQTVPEPAALSQGPAAPMVPLNQQAGAPGKTFTKKEPRAQALTLSQDSLSNEINVDRTPRGRQLTLTNGNSRGNEISLNQFSNEPGLTLTQDSNMSNLGQEIILTQGPNCPPVLPQKELSCPPLLPQKKPSCPPMLPQEEPSCPPCKSRDQRVKEEVETALGEDTLRGGKVQFVSRGYQEWTDKLELEFDKLRDEIRVKTTQLVDAKIKDEARVKEINVMNSGWKNAEVKVTERDEIIRLRTLELESTKIRFQRQIENQRLKFTSELEDTKYKCQVKVSERDEKIRVTTADLLETSTKLNETTVMYQASQQKNYRTAKELLNLENEMTKIKRERTLLKTNLKDTTHKLGVSMAKARVCGREAVEMKARLKKLHTSESIMAEKLISSQIQHNLTREDLTALNTEHSKMEVDYDEAVDTLNEKEKELLYCYSSKTNTFCGFEDSKMCGFEQMNGTDFFDWTRAQGTTPSGNTGPTGDHTCGNTGGHFMFIEASAKVNGNNAVLASPLYRGLSEHCVEFYYHMHGRKVGTLNVYAQAKGEQRRSVWRAYGNQGDVWTKARLAIPKVLSKAGYKIVFEGITQDGYEGDMAIDDISVTDGACSVVDHIRPVQVKVSSQVKQAGRDFGRMIRRKKKLKKTKKKNDNAESYKRLLLAAMAKRRKANPLR